MFMMGYNSYINDLEFHPRSSLLVETDPAIYHDDDKCGANLR